VKKLCTTDSSEKYSPIMIKDKQIGRVFALNYTVTAYHVLFKVNFVHYGSDICRFLCFVQFVADRKSQY
jgi:hypothetical protein